jgi:hypothetical protein
MKQGVCKQRSRVCRGQAWNAWSIDYSRMSSRSYGDRRERDYLSSFRVAR